MRRIPNRNDKVFDDKNYSLLQVIYRCTSTLRLWSHLQRLENRDLFTEGRLEATSRDIFSPHMGDRIISELDRQHHLRRSIIARYDMYFAFILFRPWLLDSCVHLVMQRPGVLLY
jgi:hypothetical protein